jgi:diguanylate cyclase (GGDEF)-like protein
MKDEDIAARIGGEEFVLLLPRRARVPCIADMEQLRADIEGLRPANFTITASIGLSTNLDRRERTFTELLDEADQAMYAAKQRGRNRVIY